MTLRERIADWISGGALTCAARLAKAATDEMVKKHNMAVDRGEALLQIAAQETPTANSTVKRMARIAREAIK